MLEAPQEEILIGARPEETQEIIQNNIQEQIVQETAPLAPEQSFAEAAPSQVISETQETVAEVSKDQRKKHFHLEDPEEETIFPKYTISRSRNKYFISDKSRKC